MIWLIGNKGMLGTELSLLLDTLHSDPLFEYIGTDREVDITNPSSLEQFVQRQQKSITWIINCAAYTAVDKAEDEPELCEKLNWQGVAALAELASRIGARLIHLSTDYVFDGTGNRPYTEEDETNPTGVYGRTKRDGELEILKHCANSYIIRTAWLYGQYGHNFVFTMLKLMKERDSIKVVCDQQGSPTWAYDLAHIIIKLIRTAEEGKIIPYGIYHFTNEGSTSWFDFAIAIYKESKKLGLVTKDCSISSCTTDEYPTKARRPAYSCLDKTKIKAALNCEIPVWDAALRNFLQTYQNSVPQ